MTLKDIAQFKNFHKYLEALAEIFTDRICLTNGEDPKISYSYAQLNLKVNQTVSLLEKLGIAKGDRFATLMMNCPEFFLLYLASMKMGSLIMPLIADLPLEEVTSIIRKFEAKALFVDTERVEIAIEVKDKTENILREIFALHSPPDGSIQNFHSALVNNSESPSHHLWQVEMEDPCSLYFSSGTTGKPKGIPQSPKNLLIAAAALADIQGFDKDDVHMGVLPIYHTALATYGFWPSICAGSNFVLFKKFSKTNFWRNIEKFQITSVEAVPSILAMLLNSPEDISKYNLSKLKFIGSNSAPLSIGLQNQFEKTFKIAVSNKYGLSETAPTHFNPSQPHLRKEGAIGKCLPMCIAKIFDEYENELAPKEIGEIVIRGENVISGYYKDPEANQGAFRNGWFHTGDLGYVDEDGFFFLVDRKKDMIIRGGAKIYPNEIDKVLFSLPSITEAVAFGVPDKIYGEEARACVVLEKGSALTEEEIIKYCQRYLPEYKCPRRIYFVDSIPKTASGKALRRELSRSIAIFESRDEIKR